MQFNLTQIADQPNRVAIVTGANSGLGYETTLGLARKQINVVMACRSLEKAQDAKSKILAQIPRAKLDILHLDLAKQNSVKEFAQSFLSNYDRLDLLINNAGVMVPPFELTEDGFELQFGINYLGHFTLTGLLLHQLLNTAGSRIIQLSSNAHKGAKINFEDLQFTREYKPWQAYGQSKVACLIFATELQRRIGKLETSTLSIAAHPGISDTNLFKTMPGWVKNFVAPIIGPFVTQPAAAGAEPILYGALGEDIQGGDYLGPDGWKELKGRPTKVHADDYAYRTDVADRLWEVSEVLTGISFPIPASVG